MKKVSRVFVAAFFVTCLFLLTGASQELPKVIRGGIVNGKALKLPSPEYPDWAKSTRLDGIVFVDVTIDEEGNVASAVAASDTRRQYPGHDRENAKDIEPADVAIREAAEKAAAGAKFSPTSLNGVLVKIQGTIIFRIVAGAAEETNIAPTGTTQGLVDPLKGKAINVPEPIYPDADLKGASGVVMVSVTVDQNGDVVAAKAVSGYPLLRPAAEAAAFKAKFKQTIVDGNPVQVTGIMIYTFKAPDNVSGKP